MSFDNPWLVTGLVLIGLVVVVWFVVAALRPHPIFVPEGQQVVVFQLGRFHRIDGPGPVMLNRRLDEVVRTINVRNEPENYRLDGLLSYGLPFGYTLNFWRHTDLTTAAGDDREKLVQMVLFTDEERQQQVRTLLRTTLVNTLGQLEREKPLPPDADLVQKLLPILPGMPRCDELLLRLQGILMQTLPTVGVLVDATQPMVIQGVHLGGDIIASFSQGRKIGLLRQQLPEFSDEMLFRAFGAIEGLSAIQINELIMQGNTPAIVELKQNDEGRMDPRVKIRTGEPPRPAQPASQPARAPAPPPAVRPAAGKETLTPDDLSVLKRAPAFQGEKRQAG